MLLKRKLPQGEERDFLPKEFLAKALDWKHKPEIDEFDDASDIQPKEHDHEQN